MQGIPLWQRASSPMLRGPPLLHSRRASAAPQPSSAGGRAATRRAPPRAARASSARRTYPSPDPVLGLRSCARSASAWTAWSTMWCRSTIRASTSPSTTTPRSWSASRRPRSRRAAPLYLPPLPPRPPVPPVFQWSAALELLQGRRRAAAAAAAAGAAAAQRPQGRAGASARSAVHAAASVPAARAVPPQAEGASLCWW